MFNTGRYGGGGGGSGSGSSMQQLLFTLISLNSKIVVTTLHLRNAHLLCKTCQKSRKSVDF